MKWTPPGTWWDGAEHTPWPWQAEAMVAVVDALRDGGSVVVQAVMGSGKSVLIAELVAAASLRPREVVVVTTSSQRLVGQLSETLQARGLAPGQYYARRKQATRRVIVACIDSAEQLAARLDDLGRRCVLWIADEAHRTECDTVHRAMELLAPERSVGVSATPYRSARSEELSLFRAVAYSYGPVPALRDGVILPWRVIPWTGGQAPIDEAATEMIQRYGLPAGPGVVSADSIQDAEGYAGVLRHADIRAEAIHSQQSSAAQHTLLDDLRAGRLQVLVHVAMLQEGIDLPWLRWICLRRAVSSRVRFAQEVGRVLRRAPGKEHGIVLDPHDLFGSLTMDYEAVLYGQAEETAAAPAIEIRRGEDGWWSTAESPLLAGIGPGVRVRVHRPRRPHPQELMDVAHIREDGIYLPDLQADATELVCQATTQGLSRASAAAQALVPAAAESQMDAESLGRIAAYLRTTTIEMEQAGLLERQVASRSWRSRPQTPRQRGFAARLLAGCATREREGRLDIPLAHRAALRATVRAAQVGQLTRGTLSDLIEVLKTILAYPDWRLP